MFGAILFLVIAGSIVTATTGAGILGIGATSRNYENAATMAEIGIMLLFVALIAIALIYLTLLCLSLGQLISAGIAFADRRRHNGRRCPACLGSEIIKETQGDAANPANGGSV